MISLLVAACALGAPPEKTTIRSERHDPPPHSVLTRERLDETAGGDLAAALDSEPGLKIDRLGGLGAYATLSMRGSTPEQVLVALDGIPLNPADGAPVDLSTLPLGPIGSVDIHRGRTPWSLGATGLGGALVLHTRETRSLDPSAEGELVLGAYTTAALSGFAMVPFDLGEDRGLGLTMAVDGLHTSGDFRFHNDNGTAWTDADDRLDTRQNAASDQLDLFAKARLTLGDVRITLLDLHTLAERGIPSLGVTPTTASALSLSRNLAALRLDGRLGAVTLASTAWLATTRSEVDDPYGEIGLGRGRSHLRSTVPGATLSAHLPLRSSRVLKLTPSLHFAVRHEVTEGSQVAGADRTVAAAAAEVTLRHRIGLEVGAGLRAESDLDTTALSAFAEAALQLSRVRLSAGVRHTPRLPSLFELHGDTGLALGNPALVPEHATTGELGVRWEPHAGDSASLALALFAYATWANDLIQFVQNSQGVARPENLASARILGLELAADTTLGRHVALRSALTLLDATDTSDIAARSGKALPLRPTLSTSHRVELRIPDYALGDRDGAVGVYLELDYVAGNHLDFANLVDVPPRTLLGAGAWLRGDLATVTLSLANLTSDRVQDLAGYPLPGLTAMLSLRLRTSTR